jgi:hypothetical protein
MLAVACVPPLGGTIVMVPEPVCDRTRTPPPGATA